MNTQNSGKSRKRHRKDSKNLRNSLVGLGALSATLLVGGIMLSNAGVGTGPQNSFSAPNAGPGKVALGQSEISGNSCDQFCRVDSVMHFPDDIVAPLPGVVVDDLRRPSIFSVEVPAALSYASASEYVIPAPAQAPEVNPSPEPTDSTPTPEATVQPTTPATSKPTTPPTAEPTPTTPVETPSEPSPEPSEPTEESPAPTPTPDNSAPSEPAPSPSPSQDSEPLIKVPLLGLGG